MSKIYSALIDKTIRVYLAETTEMVQKAAELHKTSMVSTEALGRALTATSIIGKLLKNKQDVLTIKITGTNQIKNILVTSDFTGRVKGYISNPKAELPYLTTTEKIHDAIGLGGNVTIIRDYGLKEPYVGISHMIAAEIDQDLAFYYKNSEQTPTDLKLKNIYKDNELVASGGILIQLLPDASKEEKELLNRVSEINDDVVRRLYEGQSAEAIIQEYFSGAEVQMLGDYDVDFECDCTRDRITRALLTVGKDELQEILAVDKRAELKCHFCNTLYEFNEEDLKEMIQAIDESNS